MLPTPILKDPIQSIWTIYFSGRDEKNRSSISYFDLHVSDSELSVVRANNTPVLTPGRLGTFDDNGVSPSCVTRDPIGRQIMYYIGWNPGSTTRVNLMGGLAREGENGKFERVMESPLLERIPTDPMLNTAPWVIQIEDKFYMYYVSGLKWKSADFPYYNIKIAKSNDGILWKREGKVVLDFQSADETALARPFVIRDENLWRMWFSKRVGNYSIGYAESTDGISWTRKDQLYGLEPTNRSGEDKMVEYGVVISCNNTNWLLYNGNDYGRFGIFYARGPLFDS